MARSFLVLGLCTKIWPFRDGLTCLLPDTIRWMWLFCGVCGNMAWRYVRISVYYVYCVCVGRRFWVWMKCRAANFRILRLEICFLSQVTSNTHTFWSSPCILRSRLQSTGSYIRRHSRQNRQEKTIANHHANDALVAGDTIKTWLWEIARLACLSDTACSRRFDSELSYVRDGMTPLVACRPNRLNRVSTPLKSHPDHLARQFPEQIK